MDKENSPIILSDWYELVEGEELRQGDILEDCPLFFPPKDIEWNIDGSIGEQDINLVLQDAIIMSHSCDLIPDQKTDIWLVI